MRVSRFLICGLAVALSTFAADTALLNLIMPEARVVAGMDVERAKDSILGRKILAEMNSKEADFAKFVTATGFDPRRDLREVLVAAVETTGKNPPALMLIRGVFDVARINAFAKTTGIAPLETIGTIDVYTAPHSKDDMAFALIDSSLAIAGTKDMVRSAIQRRSGTAVPMKADALARVQSMSRSNDIWLVTTAPVAELAKALPSGAGKPADHMNGMMNGDVFKGIEQLAMGIRFAAEMMEISAETVSATEKDATAIADVVRFLSTMVQMNRDKPEVKGLATALDGMKLTTEARTTRLTISVPTAELEKAMQNKARTPEKKI